jgi:hypothetical protein
MNESWRRAGEDATNDEDIKRMDNKNISFYIKPFLIEKSLFNRNLNK